MAPGLNAPYGARCFLTRDAAGIASVALTQCLNAPYGARCFLTRSTGAGTPSGTAVLMHLMALGAF